MNLILLTSSEVRELRQLLRDARTKPAGAEVFAALYRPWCHSAGATEGGGAVEERGC